MQAHANPPADHHEHPPHLAHHFETPKQQFESGKLGAWLFLVTEVLLFGGLFCAYTVYRNNHPEIFEWGHQWLDAKLGGLNTIVLICSSLTMAWAVRCAQLGQQKGLVILLIITLLCAGTFLVVKYVEYKIKFEHHLLPGTFFEPADHHGEEGHAAAVTHPSESHSAPDGDTPTSVEGHSSADHTAQAEAAETGKLAPDDITAKIIANAAAAATLVSATGPLPGTTLIVENSLIPKAHEPPAGLAPEFKAHVHEAGAPPDKAWIFFGIYFLMTGLHGIHVLLGMVAILYVLIKSMKGTFGPEYFTPVDLVGLYWHLVDLIWIFLFPLLYLIH